MLFQSRFQIFLLLLFANSNNNDNNNSTVAVSKRPVTDCSFSHFTCTCISYFAKCSPLLPEWWRVYNFNYQPPLYPIQYSQTVSLHFIQDFSNSHFLLESLCPVLNILLHQRMSFITDLSLIHTKQSAIFKTAIRSLGWHSLWSLDFVPPWDEEPSLIRFCTSSIEHHVWHIFCESNTGRNYLQAIHVAHKSEISLSLRNHMTFMLFPLANWNF